MRYLGWLLCLLVSYPALAEPVLPLAKLTVGALPANFTSARTGQGAPATWSVLADPTAKDGTALVQTGADPTEFRYPLGIITITPVADIDVSVRFKLMSGAAEQSGGIAIRLADAYNYLVVRANALENSVALYRVTSGTRREIKSVQAKITPGTWHMLGIRAEGDKFVVKYDDQVLFTTTDQSVPGPGKVAVWTRADSVTAFDALSIEALAKP